MAAEQRKLRTTVHVHDDDGAVHVYGPGQSVPAKHAEQIVNPKAWDDWEDPTAPKAESPEGAAPPVDGEPPRAGKGSGKDAWSDFAAAKGVEVEPGANRDDIIAACEAAGVVQPQQTEQAVQPEQA
ncbi:hypothetical protein [Kitasatospora indigofera]|uniref:hypothetical protein n=1 Tax=Kitasatospora indigofera TaxID=67307 RepID=UPI003678E860